MNTDSFPAGRGGATCGSRNQARFCDQVSYLSCLVQSTLSFRKYKIIFSLQWFFVLETSWVGVAKC